jgi:hypothetical protein
VLRRTILISILSAYALAAYADNSVILLGTASFTTNTRILYNTDNPQAIADITNLSSNFGFGAEIRVRTLWERWFIGLQIEKIKGERDELTVYNSPLGSVLVPGKEGYEILPIEISGYYTVPISSNTFEFYMGGGMGYYVGKRNYSIAGVQSRSTETNSTLGIHVSTGVRWMITPFLGIDGHLRFRDPQIDATNVFDQPSTTVSGARIPLSQTPVHTQINLNGINYSMGLAIVF